MSTFRAWQISGRCIAEAIHPSRRLRRARYLRRRPDTCRLERPRCRVGKVGAPRTCSRESRRAETGFREIAPAVTLEEASRGGPTRGSASGPDLLAIRVLVHLPRRM